MPLKNPTRRIAIIGAGFSGLCLSIQLKRLGIDSFTIFEKADRLGGTWRENTYPGAACDVPSFSYCFSFEQKTDWCGSGRRSLKSSSTWRTAQKSTTSSATSASAPR